MNADSITIEKFKSVSVHVFKWVFLFGASKTDAKSKKKKSLQRAISYGSQWLIGYSLIAFFFEEVSIWQFIYFAIDMYIARGFSPLKKRIYDPNRIPCLYVNSIWFTFS